jgi:dTDP-glucose pyrophosphorylase
MTDFTKYTIRNNATIREALIALNNLSSDVLTLFVLDSTNKMVGTLTDGDIRRKLIDNCSLESSVETVMNRNFKFIREGEIDVFKIKQFKKQLITLIPYLNANGEIIKIFNLKIKKAILPVDAVLMAGGKGERLRPLTETTPKPLLKVGNKAIIDYNVDQLIHYGIENIYVTVNYLKEQVESHFLNERRGIKVQCVREPQYLGTMGSVKFIENFNNDTVLIMNSDLFTNIDYEDFFLHFTENQADLSVAAIPYTVTVPYGIFELDGRHIKGVHEKPIYNYYANAGIYLIKKEHLDLMPHNTFFNATDLIELMVANRHKVIRYPIAGYWIDIGKHEEYQKAQEMVKHINYED